MENNSTENELNTAAGIAKIEKDFECVQITPEQMPTKILNGIKFYALGEKKGLSFNSTGGKSIITFESGQQIELALGVMNTANSMVASNGNVLYVKGLNASKIKGLKAIENKSEDYDNKILAENCKSCIIETSPVKDNTIDSFDLLVMKNCKLMKVASSQVSNIKGIFETTADVKILPPSSQA